MDRQENHGVDRVIAPLHAQTERVDEEEVAQRLILGTVDGAPERRRVGLGSLTQLIGPAC